MREILNPWRGGALELQPRKVYENHKSDSNYEKDEEKAEKRSGKRRGKQQEAKRWENEEEWEREWRDTVEFEEEGLTLPYKKMKEILQGLRVAQAAVTER